MATYYAATTGSDSNTGAILSPFRTFAKGVSLLNPGDTMYIRGGTYTERINLKSPSNKNGTSGNYLTIAGYPGETVILRCTSGADLEGPIRNRAIATSTTSWQSFKHLILDGVNEPNGVGWQLKGGTQVSGNPTDGFFHDVILDDIEIKNFPYNGLYVAASNITIRNCHIHNQRSISGVIPERWYGIYLHDSNNTVVEDCEINNNPGGGMQVYPGPMTGVIIRRNDIHDNNFLAAGVSQVGGIVFYGAGVATTYNNLIYNNGSAASHPNAPGIEIGSGSSNNKIYNNTIYGNRQISSAVVSPGIGIDASNDTGNVIQNNVVYGNIGGTQIVDNGVGTTNNHNVITDPSFINTSTTDFHISTGSTALNAGVNLSSIFTTDYAGTTRPAAPTAWTAGAYQGIGTIPDTTPPATPTGLQVI